MLSRGSNSTTFLAPRRILILAKNRSRRRFAIIGDNERGAGQLRGIRSRSGSDFSSTHANDPSILEGVARSRFTRASRYFVIHRR